MEKKINWVKIADSAAEIIWQNNQMSIIEVEGKKITLVAHNQTLFAIAHKCPHASGVMANGFIDALGNVVCPYIGINSPLKTVEIRVAKGII